MLLLTWHIQCAFEPRCFLLLNEVDTFVFTSHRPAVWNSLVNDNRSVNDWDKFRAPADKRQEKRASKAKWSIKLIIAENKTSTREREREKERNCAVAKINVLPLGFSLDFKGEAMNYIIWAMKPDYNTRERWGRCYGDGQINKRLNEAEQWRFNKPTFQN